MLHNNLSFLGDGMHTSSEDAGVAIEYTYIYISLSQDGVHNLYG